MQVGSRTSPARFVLFKPSVISAHDSHFAGGKHAFISMASTLAAAGSEVHVVSVASRGKVLVHAGMAGLLPALSFTKPGVVTWRKGQLQNHVILEDELQSGGGRSTAALSAAVSLYVRTLVAAAEARSPAPALAPAVQEASSRLPEGTGGVDCSSAPIQLSGTWVIVDADESQKLLPLVSPSPRARTGHTATRHPDAEAAPGAAGAPAGAAPAPTPDSAPARAPESLFEAVLAASPLGRCLALVQNVHFLPMGPSGTGPRSPALLAAWSRLGGILAVSNFIATYLRAHWPLAGAPQPPATTATAAALTAGAAARPPIHVTPLATWGVFGRPPFPDLAAVAEPLLESWRAAPAMAVAAAAAGAVPAAALPPQSLTGAPPAAAVEAEAVASQPTGGLSSCPSLQRLSGASPVAAPSVRPEDPGRLPLLGDGTAVAATSGRPAPRVVDVAVLKLTPEKGCSIVVELARRLAGRVRFRVVAGDPAVAAVLAPLTAAHNTEGETACGPKAEATTAAPASAPDSTAAAGAAAAAVQLWEPQPDVSAVLRGCVAVLAPSLWLEAWGMVATEALLRGLPVILSDLGGLPEAGMGVCPTVPVSPIQIPLDQQGVPDWSTRTYPRQNVEAWERALLSLLLDKDRDTGAAADGGATHECGDHLWERVSREGRREALRFVSRQGEFLEAFVAWLGGL